MQPFVPKEYESVQTDVLVIGDGIAGLSCALTLAEYGIKPLVISRGRGNTYLSQGGIAAPIGENDSPKLHFLDTLRAGRLLNEEEAVRVATYEGERAILKLSSWGISFDRKDTFYDLTLEAAHSKRRIFKVRDYTGRAIYEALHQKAKEKEIPLLKGELVEIYTDRGEVRGALVKTERGYTLFWVKALVLAVGGAASLFARNSNIQSIGGDGIGAALRAGAFLVDTEFVQFHPTVLAGTKYLISEAVRGEGALLVNDRGERFVEELAPRDVVARAIYSQLQKGRRVFLDLRPLVERGIDLEGRFPQIVSILREEGIDPRRELVPVEPAAHYFIGGIATDTYGRTVVRRLYAVGECACTGLHGANRLASNSLLEGVVFGMRAAEDIALHLPFWRIGERKLTPTAGEEGFTLPQEEIKELQNLMWEGCGIVRNGERLRETLHRLDEKLEEYLPKRLESPEGRKFFDLLLVAKAVVLNALRREESRGCHFREDFPEEREPFRRRFEVTLGDVFSATG